MKKKLLLVFCITFNLTLNAQTSWKFYRPGNTGIQGDLATALWIDTNGNPYIAANTGNWGEGGFAKFDQNENRWLNFSNVDYPILGGFENGDIQIKDIVQDANNNLWMAKNTGAIKFTPSLGPTSLVSYSIENSPLTAITYDLDIAPDGSIWFANNQLVKYNPSLTTWSTFAASNTLLSIQPKLDGNYIVWNASAYNDVVYKFDSATNLLTSSTPDNIGDIAGLPGKDCVDDSGNFWALRLAESGAYETLEYQKPNGDWVHPVHPYSNFTFYIDAFKAFGDKEAIMVLTGGEVWRFNGTSWQNYGVWRAGDNNSSIDIDAEGNVWVCGIGGAAKRDVSTGIWQRYRITNTSQIDYFVEDITIDNNNHVWMTGNAGTGIGGIQKFDGLNWQGFNPYTYGLGYTFPFLSDNASAITCRNSTNSIVFSPTFSGIYEWNGTNYITLEDELYTSKGLIEDSEGKLWCLGEYFHYKLLNETTNEWISIPIVGWGSKIIKDPTLPGTIWALTDYEIQRNNGTSVLSLDLDNFPNSDGLFTGIAVEPSGVLWIGTWFPSTSTGSSLIRYNTNTGATTTWSYDDGWPFPGEHVRPFAVTSDGKVWMQYDTEYPTEVAGIFSFDGTNVTVYPSSIGGYPDWDMLPNSNIKDVEVRTIENGYELWMSCLGRGIAVLTVINPNLGIENLNNNATSNAIIFPNSATEQVTISFSNKTAEQTQITVYDISGRLITNLMNNQTVSGNISMNWDLKSKDGVKVASGIYIIKIKTDTKEFSSKLIVK